MLLMKFLSDTKDNECKKKKTTLKKNRFILSSDDSSD